MTGPNVHELFARERKAAALATVLAEAGFGVEVVAGMTGDQRALVARMADQRTPSNETWARAVELLAHRYEVRAAFAGADPFEGVSA